MGKPERTESDQYPSWIFVLSFTLRHRHTVKPSLEGCETILKQEDRNGFSVRLDCRSNRRRLDSFGDPRNFVPVQVGRALQLAGLGKRIFCRVGRSAQKRRIRTKRRIRAPKTARATGARRSTHVSVLLFASPGGRASVTSIRDCPLRLGNR